MEAPVSVAIIGCGWAGQRHASAFAQCGAHVCWAVDPEWQRAEALRAIQTDIRIADDYDKALNDPDVEAISICLPHHLHAEVAVAAAEAGKHVLCEKPMAATLKEADDMIAASKDAGVILMIAENVRFNPAFHKIRTLLDAGVIGQPALIQITRQAYLTRSFLQDRPWFLNKHAAAGGIMMSGGIHDFETMRMLIGEIESVQALRARQRFKEMEGDDTSIAMVRFCDETVGTLVESFIMKNLITASGPEVHTLRIDGELGSIALEDGQTIQLFSERDDMRLGETVIQHAIHVPNQNTFVLEVEHFLQCIRTGIEPITSGRSQRKPLEIVLAAYQSMTTCQPVKLL